MFKKVFKSKKKDLKKQIDTEEAAKSPEQKEFERVQRESYAEANKILEEAQAHANELGWGIGTQIVQVRPNRKDIVASVLRIAPLSWEDKLALEAAKKAKAEGDTKKEAEASPEASQEAVEQSNEVYEGDKPSA